ncbi:MAG: DUF2142 domain-containing protein [Oscillospiraceae bacterium]|nr:DUF2142 domain-containing protein [Oscillospiraceae bacterium]
MKITSFVKKSRHLFCLAAIVLCAVVCMAWVGYDTVRESVGLGHRQIVNDDYSVISGDISSGIVQPITVRANTNFYGVNINLHTYNRVVFGKIFVELWDSDGNVLAVVQDDMTNIKDNTFMRFIFDEQNFKSEEDKEYQLVVYTRPETPEDKVAVWHSARTVEGCKPMTYGGQETDGTLALQYIVKYVTSDIWGYYLILCALMLILLVGAYLLIFAAKAKVQTVFAFIALVTGIIFSLYTPIRGAPDEYIHIVSSYYNSNCILVEGRSYDEGHMLMRECDADDFMNPVNYNAFELHKFYEGLSADTEGKTDLVYVRNNYAKVFPPLYWAQTLGITLARIMGLSYSMLIVLGRLANLLMYTVLCWLAVRKMPFFKTLMAVTALTPVPLQLAASFNYDPLVIGLCFLFTAAVLDLAYNKEKVTKKDTAVLAVLAAFIAPSKTIYILVVLLCLIIPPEKFGGRKKAAVNMAVVMLAAVVMWVAYNQNFIKPLTDKIIPDVAVEEDVGAAQESDDEILPGQTHFNGIEIIQVESEQGHDIVEESGVDELGNYINGDSAQYFTPGYILGHIPQTVKLVINTLQENTELYIRQIFGGIFGEVIVSPVKLSWLYVIAVMAIVFASALLPQGESLQYRGVKKWWGLAIALAVAALVGAAGIMWTPINYTTAFGIQGRYLIPVLPLIVLFFTNESITLKKKIDGTLLFAICAVNVLMLLDGLTIMLANTTVYY